MKNAYVYAIVVDGVTRYIGKGSNRRTREHFKIIRSMARRRAAGEVVQAPSAFYEKLCAAYLDGCEIESQILADGLTHDEAFRAEIAERNNYPAQQLWNEGRCWDKPEYRSRQRARWADIRSREFHREQTKKAAQQPSFVEQQRSKMRAAWADPEKRKKLHDGILQHRQTIFADTLTGRVLAFVRSNPGLTFSSIKRAFNPHRADASLRKLVKRGLIYKADGKYGAYFPTNIFEIERKAS
jgi:hypothetical protein